MIFANKTAKMSFAKTLRGVLIGVLGTLPFCFLTAQNIGIGTTSPHPSAQLEIKANNQGLLIPRLTTTQRNSIPNPAHSLLIFNIDNFCIEVYDSISGQWLAVSCPISCPACDTTQCLAPTIDSISGPDTICSGDTVQYILHGSGGNAFIWNIPANWVMLSQGQVATFIADSSGTIYGHLCNQCGCSSDSIIVIAGSAPNSISLSAPDSICLTDTLIIHSSGGIFYNWHVPSDLTVIYQGDSLIVHPTDTGTFYIKAQACNNCGCSPVDSIKVTVFGSGLTVSILGPSFVCLPDTVVYKASLSSGTIMWNYPSSWTVVSQGGDSIVLVPDTTNGVVKLTVCDTLCQCGFDSLLAITDSCSFSCNIVELIDTDTIQTVYPLFAKKISGGKILIGGYLRTTSGLQKGFVTLMASPSNVSWTRIFTAGDNISLRYIFDGIELSNGNIAVGGGAMHRGYFAILDQNGNAISERFSPYPYDAIRTIIETQGGIYALIGQNGWGTSSPAIHKIRILKLDKNSLAPIWERHINSNGTVPGCQIFSGHYMTQTRNRLYITGSCSYAFSSAGGNADLKMIVAKLDTQGNVINIKRFDNTNTENERNLQAGFIYYDSLRNTLVLPVLDRWYSSSRNVIAILDTNLATIDNYYIDGTSYGFVINGIARGDIVITSVGYFIVKPGPSNNIIRVLYVDSSFSLIYFTKDITIPISTYYLRAIETSPGKFLIIASALKGIFTLAIDSAGNVIDPNNSCNCLTETAGPIPTTHSLPSTGVTYSQPSGTPTLQIVNYTYPIQTNTTNACP